MQNTSDPQRSAEACSLHSALPAYWFIPLLLTLTLLLLCTGQILPCMKITKYWGIQKTTISIIQGVMELYRDGGYFLASLILLFSVLFPIVKLSMLLVLWLRSFARHGRRKFLHWLGVLGKWSMLDVFLAAIMIVVIQAKGLVRVQSMLGIYLFATAIFASIGLTVWISHLAEATDGAIPLPSDTKARGRVTPESDSDPDTES